MPRRKSYRRRKRKAQAIQKYSPRTGINTPLPRTFKTTLRYVAHGTIDPGAAGIPAVNVFYLNNIYDVDYTNGLNNNQHRGRDELQSLYNHAFVIRQDVKIEYGMTDNGVPNIVGMAVKDDLSADTVLVNYLESSAVKYKLIGPNGPDVGSVSMTIRPHKYLGLDWNNADLKNSSASNPTENAYLHVFAGPVDGSTDSTAVHVVMTMDTTVIFVEPRTPAQS